MAEENKKIGKSKNAGADPGSISFEEFLPQEEIVEVELPPEEEDEEDDSGDEERRKKKKKKKEEPKEKEGPKTKTDEVQPGEGPLAGETPGEVGEFGSTGTRAVGEVGEDVLGGAARTGGKEALEGAAKAGGKAAVESAAKGAATAGAETLGEIGAELGAGAATGPGEVVAAVVAAIQLAEIPMDVGLGIIKGQYHKVDFAGGEFIFFMLLIGFVEFFGIIIYPIGLVAKLFIVFAYGMWLTLGMGSGKIRAITKILGWIIPFGLLVAFPLECFFHNKPFATLKSMAGEDEKKSKAGEAAKSAVKGKV